MNLLITAIGSPAKASLALSLMNHGFKVIGVDINPLAVGRFVCNEFYTVPKASEPGFISEFVQICEKNKVDAILPSLAEEALALKKNEKWFNAIKILSPNAETIEICRDKLKTHHFLRDMDIVTPDIYTDKTPRKDMHFPIVIKPINGRGGAGIKIASCFIELRKFYKPDCIMQRYASGTEYTVDILSDLEGNPISIIPRTRLQIESGISMSGTTVNDKKLIALCSKIATELKLVGPSCIQCIHSGNDDYKFTDINLRFGGGALLGIKADPTILPNLERIINGLKPIMPNGFQTGLTMLRYYSEVYTR